VSEVLGGFPVEMILGCLLGSLLMSYFGLIKDFPWNISNNRLEFEN
jgi:hypothetical protein